jgi:3-phosphoglycerate kinase
MVETPLPPEIVIHEIEEIDLRSVFVTEHRTFTPWLGRPENLARLARSLGIEIELEAIEANSGTFRADILARNLADGTIVVIENQFGRSDHDHFGKAMTYLAAHHAKTVVWIAEAFAGEHRAALTWLNDKHS